MRRREFIILLGSTAAVWPLAARAQQLSKIRRIGFLRIGTPSANLKRVEALRVGLSRLGHVEGKNIVIEFRWAESEDQLSEQAAELVRMHVDVIVVTSSTEVELTRRATSTIPIVFAAHADPVGVGHVASLSRPAGNVTGLTVVMTDLAAKQLEILKEALPQATRIAVLYSSTAPSSKPALASLQSAAKALGVALVMAPWETAEDFENAFALMSREHLGGFVVLASPLAFTHRDRLAELGLKHRIPGAFLLKENVEAGGLMSYGADLNDLARRAATYVDRILSGARPADLPVEQALKYELVINLRTAKALGLTIPPSLLARADEVIE